MMFGTPLVLLALLAATSIASADSQTYIIHLDRTKMRTPGHTLGNRKHWHDIVAETVSEVLSQDGDEQGTSAFELLYVYETTFTGFAARLSVEQLESLKKHDAFLAATPDEMLSLHTTHTPKFLGLKPGKGLWSAHDIASDVIIGLVDTGIWPEHVSFKDSGMPRVPSFWKGTCENGTKFSAENCNKKLIGARAFFKGYESFVGRVNESTDYRSPRDVQGHGTHTASTAAGDLVHHANLFGLAKGSASGMRYKSRIAAYKACWVLGCFNSDILAAMDSAVSDGVDVLSLSLGGSSSPFYDDIIAIGAFGAVQNGVLVTCSAGNAGPSSFSVGNIAPWIMTVAASSIDRKFPTRVKLGNGQTFEGESLYSGKRTKQLPLVYAKGAGSAGAEICSAGTLSPALVKGKIVVCDRGITARVGKGEQVVKAGGAGMLLVNTENDGEELIADPHFLPATSLGASAGKAIKSYLSSAKKPTASIKFKGTVYGNTAPVMAAFSSRGPSFFGQDVIKPDVTAPGVNILAAWPPKTSPTTIESDKRRVLFNIISGTSMSCPHVSGLAALIISVHRRWSPAAIKSALMTTAYTVDNRGAPIADLASSNTSQPATPFAFGSGHVNPQSASDPGLIYDITPEDYLNYLCSLNYTSSQVASLARGNFSCPKNSDLVPGDLNYPSFAVLFDKNATNTKVAYRRTVTNVGAPRSTYVAQVDEPTGVSVTVEPKSLTFEQFGEKIIYTVIFTALGRTKVSAAYTFGSLIWKSKSHTVRSPIAVTWQEF